MISAQVKPTTWGASNTCLDGKKEGLSRYCTTTEKKTVNGGRIANSLAEIYY